MVDEAQAALKKRSDDADKKEQMLRDRLSKAADQVFELGCELVRVVGCGGDEPCTGDTCAAAVIVAVRAVVGVGAGVIYV
jgi:hypothetical protein